MLEYEAPKAFYIGASSALLTLFDERTWQRDLAMPEKEEALHSLEVDVLREVFGSFTSVNDQLNQCLAIRVEADANQTSRSARAIPCIFHSPGSPAIKVNVPDNAGEEWQRLLEAAAEIEANPTSWLEPVTTIHNILTTRKLEPTVNVAGRSLLDVAALGAKACLRHGDMERARSLVLGGLKIDPKSAELLYLGQILEREQAKAPSNAR